MMMMMITFATETCNLELKQCCEWNHRRVSDQIDDPVRFRSDTVASWNQPAEYRSEQNSARRRRGFLKRLAITLMSWFSSGRRNESESKQLQRSSATCRSERRNSLGSVLFRSLGRRNRILQSHCSAEVEAIVVKRSPLVGTVAVEH